MLAAQAACTHWHYRVEERATEVRRVGTRDGWFVALHHFPPAAGSPKRSVPVIVCHGLTSNRHNWDIDDRLSFPLWLSRRGYDTWVLELRGSGEAARPERFGDRAPAYTFDDFVDYDVPAAIEAVQMWSGAAQVHWVGHSMGGMVVYGYLQRSGGAAIRSAVAVGSPPRLFIQAGAVADAIGWLPVAGVIFDTLPSGAAAKLGAPFAWPARIPAMQVLWNDDNISAATARQAAANGIEDVSVALVRQLGAAAKSKGHIHRIDDGHDYTTGMARIDVPILFVAGALDHLAPPAVVMDGFRRVRSADKRIVVLSRANGFRHDYGHVDMTIGETAPAEVFPLLGEWLGEHD